ncbi:class I adenylate-forming enzyme family protein [Nakamurella lactea]|uniref:class I adenylate-forming enzyme family protein n=1 Tax=Nakamurella lactea TaxID=459515 RepID=UPI00048BEC89|nr:AMP-binding protein [Nakamurella lactea]
MTDLVTDRRATLERAEGSWHPLGLAARFDQLAGRFPQRPFVITAQESYSYERMRARSLELARGLHELGVRAGDAVALVIDNRPEFIAVKLAIAWVGATAVPINFSYRTEELVAVLKQSRAGVLISIDASIGVDRLAVLDELAPGWETDPDTSQVPTLREILLVDAASRPMARDLTWLAERGRGVPESVVRRVGESVDPADACDIVFTSGTSGHALGAVLSHDMVLRSAYGSAYHRGFADGWRIGFSLPMYHVFGYVEGLLASMFAGGAVVPHAVFNPRSMLTSIEQHGVNEVLLVPTMSVAIVEETTRHSYDLGSLESVFSAAAPAPVRLWERLHEQLHPRVVFTGYGQTEVSAATTLTQPADPLELVATTIGRTKLGGCAAADQPDGVLAHYRTVDPFTGAVLPEGDEGELSVRGPIVTRGYFDDPERSAELIDANGWLRTGDLGRVRADGYLELTGRSKELFKVGGELVAPQQVEQVLTAHPGVGQAFVAGVPNDRLGEVGWAWIVPVDGAVVSSSDIIRYCRAHVAGFKVPRGVTFLSPDELPMTSTGKVQKYRLLEGWTG